MLGYKKRKALERRNQKIARLYETGKYTQQEIAQKMKVSEGTVATVVKQWRKKKH